MIDQSAPEEVRKDSGIRPVGIELHRKTPVLQLPQEFAEIPLDAGFPTAHDHAGELISSTIEEVVDIPFIQGAGALSTRPCLGIVAIGAGKIAALGEKDAGETAREVLGREGLDSGKSHAGTEGNAKGTRSENSSRLPAFHCETGRR